MVRLEVVQHLPGLTPDEAEQWVGAALAQAKALRQHDARLYPLTDDPKAMETANGLHEAWRRWADEAEALLRRLPARGDGPALGGLQDLRLALGYARCVGGMPLAEVLSRHRRAGCGKAGRYTTEEARRKRGLAPRR